VLATRNTKIQLVSVAVVFLATALSVAAVPGQQRQPQNQRGVSAAELDSLSDQVRHLSELIKKTNTTLESYRSRATWLGSVAGLALAVLSIFGWQTLKKAVRRVVERNLERALSAALEQSLPKVLADTQRRAEDFLLRLAKLLALRSYGAYDEALTEFGWNGRVSSLRGETPTLRRAMIECLHSAKKNRTTNREAAWEALTELAKDDTSAETNRLVLRLAVSGRRYHEGLVFFERLRGDILGDKESALRAATLLRKVGRLNDALEVAERYADADDIESIVTVAVLQRDLGNFDEVHDVLLPAVNRLMADPSAELPDGWHRLVNTFVANSLDRHRLDDALQPAEFVLRSASGAVEIFTVGRLVLALPADHPHLGDLAERFREAVARLVPGEATTRCQVILAQLDGQPEKAIKLLQASIDEGTLPQGKGMKPDVYFQRCNLGHILITQGRTQEAIDTLIPAAGFSHGGEAKFYLAVAYGSLGEGLDAARWLTQAVAETPKWAAHARDHETLRAIPEVLAVLAKMGRP
jgi:tetratricopeptide (TPR) repeat protein